MKVYLLYPDRDFDPEKSLPPLSKDLVRDLELDTLFDAMAQGDVFVFNTVKRVMLSGLASIEEIRYRQEILKDCLRNAEVIRRIYQIPILAREGKRKQWLGIFGLKYPSSILSSSRGMLEVYLGLLEKLRSIADTHAGQFESKGFRRFFSMIQEELDDSYLAEVAHHLKVLEFRNGVLVSAELGNGNEGANYILRKPREHGRNWMERFIRRRSRVYSYKLPPRDDQGAKALGELRDRSLNKVANAVAQAAEHVESFFNVLKLELAFYIGCLNLASTLKQMKEPITFPVPAPANERRFYCRELYDPVLALAMRKKVVGNDVSANGKDLIIVTGANQGGKSTFLRSVGVAQLMMQCGIFVPAESFLANLCKGIFVHYRREEDVSMRSGKLDEELERMSTIVDLLTPDMMVLFNESFAATNEHEGSEIARQVVGALVERQIKVVFVTHLYEFTKSFLDHENVLFLRAERKAGGTRTFKLIEGKPLPTSYGTDIYDKIFFDNEPAVKKVEENTRK